MHLSVNYVSATESGDYYQVAFDTTDPADDAPDDDSPYLLIQRQFEDPDDRYCYLESHDERFIGHFRLRLTAFNTNRLEFVIRRKFNRRVNLSFELNRAQFKEVARVIDIIFDRSEA